MLSCHCETEYDPDIHRFVVMDSKYTTLQTSRRKRCCSCGTLINKGDFVHEFDRWTQPKEGTIAWYIHKMPEEPCIQLAKWYECETCSDQRSNLEELGYCIEVGGNVMDALLDYKDMLLID